MWPVLIEFRSSSSEDSCRKMKEDRRSKEEDRIAVKPKFAKNYVGRPNYS